MCELGSQLTVNMAAKVLDKSHPAGRISVSNAFNMPYKDMADMCEVLLMEKKKMSRLMSTQQKQECVVDSLSPNHGNELKNVDSSSNVDFQKVGNPPFDENAAFDFHKPTSEPLPMVCGTEYQNQPHPFKLPAASLYDNFMKAAGC
ncbi:hypothetical protein AAZX31_19G127100 [Glycine max]